ncbi:MAG: VOC family protein [Acidimicrobiia bacterium]
MTTAPVFESQARNADKVRNASSIISVPDVLETLLWYQDKLGLQVEFAWGDPVIHGSILAGDTSFHFSRSEPTAHSTGTLATSYMTLYVSELDDLFDDVSARGVTVVQPPETMEWGMRAFMVHDCNGALVMFADPSTGE